jgi:hypothetical protein
LQENKMMCSRRSSVCLPQSPPSNEHIGFWRPVSHGSVLGQMLDRCRCLLMSSGQTVICGRVSRQEVCNDGDTAVSGMRIRLRCGGGQHQPSAVAEQGVGTMSVEASIAAVTVATNMHCSGGARRSRAGCHLSLQRGEWRWGCRRAPLIKSCSGKCAHG